MAKDKKSTSMEASLWSACNKLRGSVSATDYVNVVLGLLFLRFAYDKFNTQREKISKDKNADIFLDDPKAYTKDNVFYLEETDRWNYIVKNSKNNTIYDIIDKAFKNIEKNNPSLRGALPIGFYVQLRMEPSKFSSLIDTINKMNYSTDETNDVIGRVYEYFLKKFCIVAKSEKGEFYTPASIVELMTDIIQPYKGSVYDPCCGSGGMFVQSAEFIKKHKDNTKNITIYGQESNPKTYKLARMNLAIRGLNCDLGDIDADTFLHDKHKDLRADFILANPPFNLRDWRTEKELKDDGRWKGFPVPPVSNANYAWILHMLARLSSTGVAAFLLANGSLSSGSEGTINEEDGLSEEEQNGKIEYNIRKKLINDNNIEAIIVLPRGMFYATDISVTLWIMVKGKKERTVERDGKQIKIRNREGEILFIDARTLGDKGKNEDKYVILTEEDKQRIKETIFNWESPDYKNQYKDIPEFCRSVSNSEIAKNDYDLRTSKYIEFIDHDLNIDYEKEMKKIQDKMKKILQEEEKSQESLKSAFEGIGYEL